MELKNVTIRMPADLAKQLEKVADSEDRSVNQQLIRIVREWLERYEKEKGVRR